MVDSALHPPFDRAPSRDQLGPPERTGPTVETEHQRGTVVAVSGSPGRRVTASFSVGVAQGRQRGASPSEVCRCAITNSYVLRVPPWLSSPRERAVVERALGIFNRLLAGLGIVRGQRMGGACMCRSAARSAGAQQPWPWVRSEPQMARTATKNQEASSTSHGVTSSSPNSPRKHLASVCPKVVLKGSAAAAPGADRRAPPLTRRHRDARHRRHRVVHAVLQGRSRTPSAEPTGQRSVAPY